MTTNEFVEMIDSSVEHDISDQTISEEDFVADPTENDPGWSEWIMDQLDDSELYKGAPKTDGLRRVTNKVYGEILKSETERINEVFDSSNSLVRVSACHVLQVRKYNTGSVVSVNGYVDSRFDKTPMPFREHLISTVDTKAEGKALRRLLKLRVLTAEEMPEPSEEEASGNEPINDQQVAAINTMCKRSNVNVKKLMIQLTGNNKLKHINDASYLSATNALSVLSNFQRKKETVSKNLLGYDPNWRDEFSRGN